MIAVTQAAKAKKDGALVILGSSITALAVARDAYASQLKPIIFDRKPDIACHSRVADVELSKSTSDLALIRAIVRLGKDRQNFLLSTSDYWLDLIVKYRKVLEEAYAAILHPSNDVLRICMDKKQFSLWCRQNGISAPALLGRGKDIAVSTRACEQLPFPVFLRPSMSSVVVGEGIPKSIEVADADCLRYWLSIFYQKNVDFILTESLLGQNLTQYSVPLVRRPDRFVSFVAEYCVRF